MYKWVIYIYYFRTKVFTQKLWSVYDQFIVHALYICPWSSKTAVFNRTHQERERSVNAVHWKITFWDWFIVSFWGKFRQFFSLNRGDHVQSQPSDPSPFYCHTNLGKSRNTSLINLRQTSFDKKIFDRGGVYERNFKISNWKVNLVTRHSKIL